MVSKVNCCAITGTEVLPICVETDVCSGLPSFDMVGLLSSEIKESREGKNRNKEFGIYDSAKKNNDKFGSCGYKKIRNLF